MKNIHRAWAVCLGCTLALLVCGGLCINAFSVTQTSMITTACSVTFLLCMFVVNAYYEKLGYRAGLTLAVLLGVGSFVLFDDSGLLSGGRVVWPWRDASGKHSDAPLVLVPPGHGHRHLRGGHRHFRRRLSPDF